MKQALLDGQFFCVLEIIPRQSSSSTSAHKNILRRGHLAGWPLFLSFSDRVGLHCDLSPLEGAAALGDPSSSLLHFSGKDRERIDLLLYLDAMKARGLSQLLLLSGDRLPGHHPEQSPVHYLESVPALQIARTHCPDWLLGAALNPFKYLEEEGCAQYLKAQKKILAGADFLTLQLGFDAAKHLEAQTWMSTQADAKPMLACVMQLTAKRATGLNHVPGIVITKSMRAVLDRELNVSLSYADTRSFERLGLQIVGLQLMGYAGVYVSGVHALDELIALEQVIGRYRDRISSVADWMELWLESWEIPGAPKVCFTPESASWEIGQSDVKASHPEQLRYTLLSEVHHLFFSRYGWLSKAFGWSVTRPFWKNGTAASALHALERAIKRPLVGCDTCGNCRLHDTFYVCPETCPKGLANGPCGGTHLNRCEFGDRECIHSVKYRIAKSVNQLPLLSQSVTPCIDAIDRRQSSWPKWFKQDPEQ